MTQDILLYQLRYRLKSAQERMVEYQLVPPSDKTYLYVAGQIIELMTLCEWLAGLIADIEREEVTP